MIVILKMRLKRLENRLSLILRVLLMKVLKVCSMIRLYDLVKRHGSSVLICEVRRFLRDTPCVLSHSFDTGSTTITAPASWTNQERTDCYRHFDELLQSPHWLAEIQPCLKRYDDDYSSLFDAF